MPNVKLFWKLSVSIDFAISNSIRIRSLNDYECQISWDNTQFSINILINSRYRLISTDKTNFPFN